MASVHRRGRGWVVMVDLPRLNGKRRQKQHGGFTSRLEAEVFRARLLGGRLDREARDAILAMPDAPPPPPRPAVYFVQEEGGGPIKIGLGRGVCADRLSDLQIGNSRQLILLGTIPGGRGLESAVHERFAEHRIRGEWFGPAPELLAFVRKSLANPAQTRRQSGAR